ATLPRFRAMELSHGSLTRAMLAKGKKPAAKGSAASADSGARYSLFVAPKQGMHSFAEALVARLAQQRVTTHLNTKVERLARSDRGWELHTTDSNTTHEVQRFDGVILATSSLTAGKMLAETDSSLAELLNGIEYASSAVVLLGYEQRQLK